jgi:hypothetical protein
MPGAPRDAAPYGLLYHISGARPARSAPRTRSARKPRPRARRPALLRPIGGLLPGIIAGLTRTQWGFIVSRSHGGCGLAVKAPDCGSGYRGFESRHPPSPAPRGVAFRPHHYHPPDRMDAAGSLSHPGGGPAPNPSPPGPAVPPFSPCARRPLSSRPGSAIGLSIHKGIAGATGPAPRPGRRPRDRAGLTEMPPIERPS